jgi:pimeloyl-ACP methyl ester carboxylesterase
MTAETTPRLILLPGLGADARLLEPQLDAFPGSICPPWIPPLKGETLPAYAGRFAATLDTKRPTILCGFSFGGMVALEIARVVEENKRPAGVILLSGIRSRRAVSAAFRLQQAIGTRVPKRFAKKIIAGPLTTAFAKRDGLSPGQTRTLRAMALDIDADFLFWAARACARWTCDGSCPVSVAHAHGRHDRIIPYVPHPSLPGGEATLMDAGHLIPWTATEAVNAFIRGAAASMAGPAPTMDA